MSQSEQINALVEHTKLSAIGSILSTVGCIIMGVGCLLISGMVLLLML